MLQSVLNCQTGYLSVIIISNNIWEESVFLGLQCFLCYFCGAKHN
uniref:Uncharacterized protein n=1 Tax=Rhizophora mucronata TaxID=61149 RepID=A0A2P2PCB0_RHIMU